MINKLYSLLTDNIQQASQSGFYNKKRSAIVHTDLSRKLRDVIMDKVPERKKLLFAATICYLVRFTQFAEQVIALDPNNTYVHPERPDDAEHDDQKYCLYNAIDTIDHYNGSIAYLDKDIRELLNTSPTWIEYIGAYCLQMLREVG